MITFKDFLEFDDELSEDLRNWFKSDLVNIAKKIRVQFITINEEIGKLFSIDDYVRVLPSGLSHMIDSGS